MRYTLGPAVILTLLLTLSLHAQETRRQYLSGKGTADAVPWEFLCSSGAKSGEWTTIPVPSCWDALGFGTLNYYRDGENPEQGKRSEERRVGKERAGRRRARTGTGCGMGVASETVAHAV